MNPSVVKTRTVSLSWGKSVRCLMTGRTATGVEGGVSRTQALAWNCRNQALDARGEAQAAPTVRREYPMQEIGADRSLGALRAL
ncbi:hypothetical protein ACVWY2_008633 [Bradyrhizobium sp. JR6.1]